MKRIAVAGLVLAAAGFAGCVSQSDTQTGGVKDSSLADARRRAEVHTSLAGEYYQRGAIGVALQETRAALKDDSNYVPAYNMQGLILMELREDAGAKESFERAIRLDPNNAEVMNNYGWFLCTRNEAARGIDLLTRAANDPLYPTPEKSYLSAGLCMRRASNLAEAERYFRRAISLRPDLIGALYNLAEVTYERGEAKDAEAFLNRYMRVSQPTLESLTLGVKIARLNGDRASEESFMQQLRRRFPDATQTKELEGGTKP
ncbi:type IV pilus biogenesis/stability protein PilW [Betaproteobacteria bacterium GR16-43]|nr:type IV pilus biogenesis/stability protein PilW [Betaproteobacteria bacterium GR16-43]